MLHRRSVDLDARGARAFSSTNAYLDVRIAVAAPSSTEALVDALLVSFLVEGEAGERRVELVAPLTLPLGNAPVHIQIPTAVGFHQSDRIVGLSVSGDWIDGSVLRLDDVAIVY